MHYALSTFPKVLCAVWRGYWIIQDLILNVFLFLFFSFLIFGKKLLFIETTYCGYSRRFCEGKNEFLSNLHFETFGIYLWNLLVVLWITSSKIIYRQLIFSGIDLPKGWNFWYKYRNLWTYLLDILHLSGKNRLRFKLFDDEWELQLVWQGEEHQLLSVRSYAIRSVVAGLVVVWPTMNGHPIQSRCPA